MSTTKTGHKRRAAFFAQSQEAAKMFMSMQRPILAIATLALVLTGGVPAMAKVLNYKASLKGASEMPATMVDGTGKLTAKYNTVTKMLSWTVTYDGLTGAATAAHFHGPAMAMASAPPVVPLSGNLESPIKGKAEITAEQAADLAAGRWYINVHTAANPDGELRGQVVKK